MMRIKKAKFIILASVIVVLVILLSAFWIIPQIYPASKQTQPSKPIQSVSGYYLTYEGNISRIFVVSANASYGKYPYSTQTTLNGSVVKHGEPCVIINVTVRNDYSTQYPPPNPNPYNSTVAWVYLTAQLFSGEKQISATDLLLFGMPPSAGAFVSLNSGENGTLTIFLATKNTDITSFQIVTRYITGLPLP